MEIRIFKSDRRLELWEKECLVGSFPIAVGRTAGHKEREGDLRTPEGAYVICVKNPKSKYHLSLGINYPNNDDAGKGLQNGLLCQREYDAICLANEKGHIPPWETPLGGEIYIHGELEKQNWSHGCIRMYNKDIHYLFHQVTLGTRVLIKP